MEHTLRRRLQNISTPKEGTSKAHPHRRQYGHALTTPRCSNAADPPQYLTFELDSEGWNNVRFTIENALVIAGLTCRTLVLPPPDTILHVSRTDSEVFSLNEFVRFDPSLSVISMDEFLEHETRKSAGRFAADPPPRISGPFLWAHLRSHGTDPNWRPSNHCVLFGQASGSSQDMTSSERHFCESREVLGYDATLAKSWLMHLACLNCCPLGVPAGRRCRWMVEWSRMAWPFYTFLKARDAGTDRWAKRLVRDGMGYSDGIMAAAMSIVHHLKKAAEPSQLGTGARTAATRNASFVAAHVRRGDLKGRTSATDQGFFRALGTLANMSAAVINEGDEPKQAQVVVFVSSLEPKSYFDPLLSLNCSIFMLSDFDGVMEAHGLRPQVHGGLVEQVVAAYAEKFVGTDTSTFSSYIIRLRGYLGLSLESARLVSLSGRTVHLKESDKPRNPWFDREWSDAWKDIDEKDTVDAPLVLLPALSNNSATRRSWSRVPPSAELASMLRGGDVCAGLAVGNMSALRASALDEQFTRCTCAFIVGDNTFGGRAAGLHSMQGKLVAGKYLPPANLSFSQWQGLLVNPVARE